MKLQILMATMNRESDEIIKLVQSSKIHSDILLVNQCGMNEQYVLTDNEMKIQVLNTNEVGLSKSRNYALKHATSELCLIADDDILYEEDLSSIICNAFNQHPNYDIIAFYVERSTNFNKKKIGKLHKINKLQSLGLMSVQIAFRRNSVLKKGVTFDELFGAGSGTYICGEENIFLMDCIKKGCKLLYVPEKIASTTEGESSWFRGHNELYFRSKGAVFQRLFPKTAILFIYVFGILKHHEYGSEMSILNALRYMMIGRKELIDEHEK